MADPWKVACPACGKKVTKTKAGNLRHHKCEPPISLREAEIGPNDPVRADAKKVVGRVTPEAVIKKYVETRDEISALKKKFDASIAELKEVQEKREKYLQGILSTQRAESIKTSAGTVFVDWKDSATVEDQEAFLSWVAREWYDRKHFLEKRVSKGAVKQLHEDGEVAPPGVSYKRFKSVKIRRS